MTVFDEIKVGLNEAIEYEKGDLKAHAQTRSVTPVETFTSSDIKGIRKPRESAVEPISHFV